MVLRCRTSESSPRELVYLQLKRKRNCNGGYRGDVRGREAG